MRFYLVALKDSTTPAARALAEPAAQWVTGLDGTGIIKGRMKFCRPVLRAVARVDHALAETYFTKARESFHPIARKLIEKVCQEALLHVACARADGLSQDLSS